jgi:hypothetical protein
LIPNVFAAGEDSKLIFAPDVDEIAENTNQPK